MHGGIALWLGSGCLGEWGARSEATERRAGGNEPRQK